MRSPMRSSVGRVDENAGHVGMPKAFGSPDVAKLIQYVIIVAEIRRSTSVHGRFSLSSVPKTYGTSDVWNAPNCGCSGHGIAWSKK